MNGVMMRNDAYRIQRQASKGVPLGSSLTTNGVGKKVRTDEVLDTITDILSEGMAPGWSMVRDLSFLRPG